MIQPTASFKENLAQLPAVDDIARIELTDASGAVVATIPNQQGKQGSLVVYRYLAENFATLDADAATHGTLIFGEHTQDAKNRPGAHPNIDRLFEIIAGAAPMGITVIAA